MRRDVYIQNDSGGFSVVAADAVAAMIEDGRADDSRFVASYKALLLELIGDDSMPVRLVVDEPLREDEEAQWLAKTSWRIDTSDGRLLVMGGFDPDVMQGWADETSGSADGRGVALFDAPPGSVHVDVYAHVGSMNGRQILSEAGEKPGAAFRRRYPGQPFPLWLAKMLEFSGEDDPGYEALWTDVRASIDAGALAVDLPGSNAIGFLVHVTRADGKIGEPPEGAWFAPDENRRVPDTFPIGLPTESIDPNLDSLRDRLLGRSAPEPERATATTYAEIIESWSGDPLRRLDTTRSIQLPAQDAHFLYWLVALTVDSPPRFELWVTPKGSWPAPPASSDYAVVAKSGGVLAIGSAPDLGGWALWSAARAAARTLTAVPDGSEIDFAMAPRGSGHGNPAVGLALFNGTVTGGQWTISSASPSVPSEVLGDALAFVRDLAVHGRIALGGERERAAFDRAAMMFAREEGALAWAGDTVTLSEPDERTLLLLASPVFRARFGGHWAVEAEETW